MSEQPAADRGGDSVDASAQDPVLDPLLNRVQAVVASVADADQLPLDERLARFDAAHRALSEALGDPAPPR